jgi:hypothetical protein
MGSIGRNRSALTAGWLMIAIGFLMLLCGGCVAACGVVLPNADLPPDQKANLPKVEAEFHGSLTVVCAAMGIIIGSVGLYHIITGFFVRKGQRGALYTAIVSSFLTLGWCGINTLGAVLGGATDALAGVLLMTLIGGAFVVLLGLLFQALREPASAIAAAQYQAQYWQSLQQQRAFSQPGMVLPPPMNPAAIPAGPPEPPFPEPMGWAYGAQTLALPPPPPSGAAGG